MSDEKEENNHHSGIEGKLQEIRKMQPDWLWIAEGGAAAVALGYIIYARTQGTKPPTNPTTPKTPTTPKPGNKNHYHPSSENDHDKDDTSGGKGHGSPPEHMIKDEAYLYANPFSHRLVGERELEPLPVDTLGMQQILFPPIAFGPGSGQDFYMKQQPWEISHYGGLGHGHLEQGIEVS